MISKKMKMNVKLINAVKWWSNWIFSQITQLSWSTNGMIFGSRPKRNPEEEGIIIWTYGLEKLSQLVHLAGRTELDLR